MRELNYSRMARYGRILYSTCPVSIRRKVHGRLSAITVDEAETLRAGMEASILACYDCLKEFHAGRDLEVAGAFVRLRMELQWVWFALRISSLKIPEERMGDALRVEAVERAMWAEIDVLDLHITKEDREVFKTISYKGEPWWR